MVISEETKSGGRLLDSNTYEQLSAISTAAASDSSTYFNTTFAETATTNDEWLIATKRRRESGGLTIYTYTEPLSLIKLCTIL